MGHRITKRDSFSDKEKEFVYKLFKGKCADCNLPLFAKWHAGGRPGCPKLTFTIFNAHIHHVIPFCKGGTHQPSNWVLLCLKCHTERHRILMSIDSPSNQIEAEKSYAKG